MTSFSIPSGFLSFGYPLSAREIRAGYRPYCQAARVCSGHLADMGKAGVWQP